MSFVSFIDRHKRSSRKAARMFPDHSSPGRSASVRAIVDANIPFIFNVKSPMADLIKCNFDLTG